MEMRIEGDKIELSRILSVVDEFVIDFISVLEKAKIEYVIVSGYAALLFGRERITEDVDVLFRYDDQNKINRLYDIISKDYWVLNAKSLGAVHGLFKEGCAIRIAEKNEIAPNIELKPVKNEFDEYSMANATNVVLNKRHTLRISPLELQIPYKLYLGSRKDLEDARFLYNLFGKSLKKEKFSHFCGLLKVTDKVSYLGEKDG